MKCVLKVLEKWGQIKCFRFDNGRPFGNPKRELVSQAGLHLIARGCQVMFNPPRTPTKNAKVERCQGTTGKWSDARNCKNIEEFRRSLEYAVIAQRERYPTRVCQKKTRIQFYPELLTNPNRYQPLDYDPQRVFGFLTKGKWFRAVSKVGQMEIFGKSFQVGLKHKKKNISVILKVDNKKAFWYCFDEKQEFLTKIYATNLNDGTYFNLSNISKNSN